MDLTAFRERLEGKRGPQYWRSLDELAQTDEFVEFMHREFPTQASEWSDPSSRRNFLRLMGASLALAGVSGCAYTPTEKLLPYVKSPEELVPGKPMHFATALPLPSGHAIGVVVTSHMGRPTKIEGNPDHPSSLGATDARTQAEILCLYDPDRSQVVMHNGRVSTWNEVQGQLLDIIIGSKDKQGEGVRILSGTITSPTAGRLLGQLVEKLPKARWHVHEPVGRGSVREGTRLALGQSLDPVWKLNKAQVVVSLGGNFLSDGPAPVRAARDFIALREPKAGVAPAEATMNRLYVAENTPTITGTMADHRLSVQRARLGGLCQALAQRLGVAGVPALDEAALGSGAVAWLDAAVADLQASKGSSLVLAGDDQPAAVHALVCGINDHLGNTGETLAYVKPADQLEGVEPGDLAGLVQDMQSGAVGNLIILGSNPAYDAPADLPFVAALAKVPMSIHLGQYEDETGFLCNWHVPAAHPLESWGDLAAHDGTVTIQQPLIAPLYGGKTAIELLAFLARSARDETALPLREEVKDTWKETFGAAGFAAGWTKALNDGVVPGSVSEPVEVSLAGLDGIDWSALAPPAGDGLELVLGPDPTVWDGRYANSGWLQELPKPLSKVTWDNAAILSVRTAAALNLSRSDMVTLSLGERTVEAAVWVQPGQADDSVTLHLGYGRARAGRVGNGLGFNAYAIRTSDRPWGGTGLTIKRVSGTYPLASTVNHWTVIRPDQPLGGELDGREIIYSATLDEFRANPEFAHGEHHEDMSLFKPPEPQRVRQEDGVGNAWAMAINLNACIGCSACVVACQAENNIAVVGKEQVIRQREMHWIRIDHYFKGDPSTPDVYHQPVPCMHCESAPCEVVCPVAATSHSAEGLNEMTYNRCVGTRYCGNNCPFKVRRFNFLQYTDRDTPSLKFQRNPDVTVRTRGVMEKCTYCVQRISRARIESEIAGDTRVRHDAVVTACQQACPTQAIVFGNLNDVDPDNRVVQARNNPRGYAMLASLNVRPRTTYLAKLTNPRNGDSGAMASRPGGPETAHGE